MIFFAVKNVFSCQVTLTEFKPVWPASGRDFCNFVVVRELAEGVFCVAYEAVSIANFVVLSPEAFTILVNLTHK